MEEKDLKIICRLRNDGRENLTKMSRFTSIPVSTIHDRLKKYKLGLIKKHTVLLDFKKMGYGLKVGLLIKVAPEHRRTFRSFLEGHSNVNNVFRINNGYDFLVEALFRDINSFKNFSDRLGDFGDFEMQEHFIMEDIKREGFLTDRIIHSAA